MTETIVVPAETPLGDVASMAREQGCRLVGRPGRLSMERAIKGLNEAVALIEAGEYAHAVAMIEEARCLALGDRPCAG